MRLVKASDLLAAKLRSQILMERLPPGASLPSEAELIKIHSVSRGTVREALRLLEIERIIEIRRGVSGGVRVAEPDVSAMSTSFALLLTLDETPLRQFIAFRRLVEPFVAAEAATHITDAQRDELTKMLEGHAAGLDPEAARQATDRSRWCADFHSFLGHCSGNGVLGLLLESSRTVLQHHIRSETIDPQNPTATFRSHDRIGRGILAGDPDEARRYMEIHLDALERVFEERGILDEPTVPRSRWLPPG